MFWENFVRLCNKAGKSPSRVAVEIGLSSTSAVGWKKGAAPRPAVLARLSDYFGVSVKELTREEPEQERTSAPNSDTQTDETQLLTYFRQFNREGRGRMLDFADSMQRSGKYAACANSFAQ